MNPPKLVSVIIPVYNVAKFVEKAIVSIVNQTYKNLEIIIIDDGSSDATYKIVDGLARHDHRIKLYKNERNLNIVKTLNRALSLAQGDYIARMDGDDISVLDRIEKQVDFLESNPDYGLVGCSVILINENSIEVGRKTIYSNYGLLMKFIKYTTSAFHPTWLVRKSVYTQLNGYRDMPGVEDYDFLLRMISAGLEHTNLKMYYGLFYRIDRVGNSDNVLGMRQSKMGKYAYKLFVERQKTGHDSFSENGLKQATNMNIFLLKIHDFAYSFTLKANKAKHNDRVIKKIFYRIIAMISPYYVVIYFKVIWLKLFKLVIRHRSTIKDE